MEGKEALLRTPGRQASKNKLRVKGVLGWHLLGNQRPAGQTLGTLPYTWALSRTAAVPGPLPSSAPAQLCVWVKITCMYTCMCPCACASECVPGPAR